MLVVVAFGGGVLALAVSGAGAQAPLYTRPATQACLARLPDFVAGLPPASPPVPPVLFVYALARNDISAGGADPRARAHKQLGVWYGKGSYRGIILSFFKSVPDARASFGTLAWLYGGQRIRNVVATWDQKAKPERSVRKTVSRCLRSGGAGAVRRRTAPSASFATFAGWWGGHTRGLPVTLRGRGREYVDAGCCTRAYELRFQILSVSGTIVRATAVYRVTSFRRYENGVRKLHVGDVGKLVLRNGIVTNTLTQAFFCSEPAWGATYVCGA
jgi:hypothetical protein